jgi:MoaA/NifB/PqqE/SkfB family radical SAM enzyme
MTAECRIPRLDFELTPGCDHACAHCYNVWNADAGDPQAGYDKSGQLRTPELLALMTKAVQQTGAHHITLTGGEPLLRKDALDVVDHACSLASSVTLITNGSHVGPDVAARLARAKVTAVQLTLLAADRAEHDRLKGAVCFDDTVRAAVELREAGVHVQVCFVAMHENAAYFAHVMELCFVLGVRSISYNRMSPTGGAIHHVARLMPTIEQIEANLDVAERLGPAWGIHVATAMPIPPCLIRLSRYSWVKFGFCSTGTSSPNIVIDAAGNVRSCNLSRACSATSCARTGRRSSRTRTSGDSDATCPRCARGARTSARVRAAARRARSRRSAITAIPSRCCGSPSTRSGAKRSPTRCRRCSCRSRACASPGR